MNEKEQNNDMPTTTQKTKELSTLITIKNKQTKNKQTKNKQKNKQKKK